MLMADELSDNLEDYIQISCIFPLFQSTRIGFNDYYYCRIICKDNTSYLSELKLSEHEKTIINWSLLGSWS
jgi:hypothetical protein